MRQESHPFAIFATCAAALYLVVIVLLSPGARAAEPTPLVRLSPDPLPYDLRQTLDDNDEIATLDAIGIALGQVADGGTYIWQRLHGRLSGVVQPTQSFKDAGGNVCRHVIVVLTSGRHSQRTEGIACRLSNGRWQLDG